MLSIILFFSFLLHIVAFWMIYSLHNKLKRNHSTDLEEISELLELYLDELKEENKQLMDELNNNTSFSAQEKESEVIKNELNNHPVQNDELPLEKVDLMETSLEAEVLHLYQKMYTPNDIARKLNCGKTEVELIIKFHKKKGANT